MGSMTSLNGPRGLVRFGWVCGLSRVAVAALGVPGVVPAGLRGADDQRDDLQRSPEQAVSPARRK
jgi:hypothetical protein